MDKLTHEIISYLLKESFSTSSHMAELFNVSEKTIKRDLYVLRDMSLVKYVGSNKTGHWEIVDSYKAKKH